MKSRQNAEAKDAANVKANDFNAETKDAANAESKDFFNKIAKAGVTHFNAFSAAEGKETINDAANNAANKFNTFFGKLRGNIESIQHTGQFM